MPRYGYGQGADPTEMQQLSGNPFYNPTSPNPDWVRGLQYLYANLQGAKDKKKSEQQEAEDRQWKQLLTAAQISNLGETTQPREVKPTSDISPKAIKDMMNRLGYDQSVIDEVDSMNQPMRAQTWKDVQADFRQRGLQGMKIPKTPPSQVGKQHLAKLKVAIAAVEKRKAPFTGALSQLWGSPDKMIGSEQHVKWLQEENDKIDEQTSALALMAQEVDDTGELSAESQKKLDSILRFRSMYRAPQKKTYATGKDGRIWTTDGITWYNEKTGLPVK